MKTSRTKIAQTIADKLQSGISTKQLSREVAAYLIAERRTGELDSLLRDVQLLRANAGEVEVLAYSAHELTAETKTGIEAQFKKLFPDAKHITITEVHDADILGGVRLQLADRALDLSVEAKLNKFKQLTAE